ncbi:MAG: hypothetical protein MZV70_05090 [Desulfobacterales bacterium]|nr:hypothetical protein [Desulfobacterales bacterium]
MMALGGHGTANMTGNIAPRRDGDHLQALGDPRGRRRLPRDLSETPAADPVHLLEGQPRAGQVPGAGAGAAGRRAAQAVSRTWPAGPCATGWRS